MAEMKLHEAAEFLNHFPTTQYWEMKIPCEYDEVICRICESYQNASLRERQEFREKLEVNGWHQLWVFLGRAAMLGARERSTRWVVCGLIALTICAKSPRTEYYDVLMDLSTLHRSACIVGDPRRIFEVGVRHEEDKEIRSLILGFLDRKPRDQRPEVMGWEVIEGPSGLIYRFGNRPIPEGHL